MRLCQPLVKTKTEAQNQNHSKDIRTCILLVFTTTNTSCSNDKWIKQGSGTTSAWRLDELRNNQTKHYAYEAFAHVAILTQHHENVYFTDQWKVWIRKIPTAREFNRILNSESSKDAICSSLISLSCSNRWKISSTNCWVLSLIILLAPPYVGTRILVTLSSHQATQRIWDNLA